MSERPMPAPDERAPRTMGELREALDRLGASYREDLRLLSGGQVPQAMPAARDDSRPSTPPPPRRPPAAIAAPPPRSLPGGHTVPPTPWRFRSSVAALGAVLCALVAILVGGVALRRPPGIPEAPTALVGAVPSVATQAVATTRPAEATRPALPDPRAIAPSPAPPTPGVAATPAVAGPPRADTPAGAAPRTPPPPTIPPSLDGLRQLAALAERQLRSGQLEVALDYSNGTSSAVLAAFDFGDARTAPALHLTTTYRGLTSLRRTESIAIGDLAWESQGTGWIAAPTRAPARAQLDPFLPHSGAVTTMESDSDARTGLLHWRDAERGVEVLLEVDPVTGTPRRLRQTMPTHDATMTVLYHSWNVPVRIDPPPAPRDGNRAGERGAAGSVARPWYRREADGGAAPAPRASALSPTASLAP